MQTVSDLFPEKWLKADHLNGRSAIVTITRVTVEEIHNPRTRQEEKKLVLEFRGKEKRMILNKTQAFACAEVATTEHFHLWIGKKIMISPGRARAGQPTIVIGRPPQTQPDPTPAETVTEDADNATV
jgi:hypothetical protein